MGQVQAGPGDCDLTFTVELIGVRRNATLGIEVGDTLDIGLVGGPGSRAAVCLAPDGSVVGALAAFRGLVSLLGCLARGVRFDAAVEDVGATRCTVTVTRSEA